jgi:predicted neutral ceramidase superfamily lipid hydrolase
LLEFCTSDSHDLAARGLTVNRGYKALGEATPVGLIAESTVSLAKLAESRLSKCTFAAGTMASEVSLFGASALGEFAAIARESSVFSKRYALFGVATLVVLLLVSLVL